LPEAEHAVSVLIAEDSATQAVLLQTILEDEGFRVRRARDGHEAAKAFDQQQSDIVLSDIMMPGMDGFELCRHVKRSANGRRVPVILLTAMHDPMDIARGLESGADNFITKPYDPAELVGKVRRALEPVAGDAPSRVNGNEDRAQMTGLLVSAFEETARKGAELELRNQELATTKAKLEASAKRLLMEHENILDAVGEGIVGVDAAGKVTLVNPSAARVLGWRASELVGVDIHRAFMPTQPDGSPFPGEGSPVTAVLGGHEPYFRAQAVFRRKDGSPLPVEQTCTPLTNDHGVIVGAVMVFRDISEQQRTETNRLKLEDQLRQTQKMDAIGRLAGGVAHDFNNLLTVIIGFSGLLLAQPFNAEVDRKRVRQIREAADYAAHLTRQLLTFSRKQVVHPTAIILGEVVLGIEPMISRLVGENIEVRLEVDARAGWVMGDAGQLGQVIMNLVVNARDAMPDGGKIMISTANAEPADDPEAPAAPGPHVRLSVRDTGTGMTEETKTRLFEPFFTTKAPGAGTGLGLSTVFGIVQQNGGVITVQTAVGRGTTFNIFLPRIGAPAAAAPRAAEDGAAVPRRHANILVVEDQDEIRDLVAEVLKNDGHRVFTAGDPQAAIEVATLPGNRVEVLLTDVVMPVMSGLELASVLKEKIPALRVLYMSGYTAQGQGSLPPEAFIQKPFSPAVLSARVQKLLTA